MHVSQEHSHRFGADAIREKGLLHEVRAIVDLPELSVSKKATGRINDEIQKKLSMAGWALNPSVKHGYNLSINAIKQRVALNVQTGNAVRAFYDLMKFQAMHLNGRADACVLIVFTSDAAKVAGSNLANFGRVTKELTLFEHVITIPCLVIGLDDQREDESR